MPRMVLDKSAYRVLHPLFWQLRFSPPPTLLDQTYRAERLLRLIDPAKRYPFDFVCFKLTDYRSKQPPPIGPMSGRDLQADLARFICDVSSQAAVDIHKLPEPALTIQELARQADVSSKTIRRWVKHGLPVRSVATPQGPPGHAVLTSTWQWFLDRHEKLAARAAAFSRLTTDQRRQMVHEARKLFDEQGLNRYQIENYLAKQFGRARETIRHILRRHDAQAPPGRRIFPVRRKISDADKTAIWELFRRGVPVARLAHRFGRSASTMYRLIHEGRTRHWLSRHVDFVYSHEFDLPNANEIILASGPADLTTRLHPDHHVDVLTRPQERALFRAYNYLKFRQSETVKAHGQAAAVPSHVLDQLDDIEERTRVTREVLIRANRALVISIAKRHVQGGLTLDELISEGTTPLLKAIEKFDYTKGYKFSTYASWAIMKHFARAVPEHGERGHRYQAHTHEQLDLLGPGVADVDETVSYRRSHAVQQALRQLDDREKHILTNRYRLDRESEPMSLAQLGRTFGISKERVRQLEARAMDKMYTLLKEELAADER